MPNKPLAIYAMHIPKAESSGPPKDFAKREGDIKISLLLYNSYDCSPKSLKTTCFLSAYISGDRVPANKAFMSTTS